MYLWLPYLMKRKYDANQFIGHKLLYAAENLHSIRNAAFKLGFPHHLSSSYQITQKSSTLSH